MDDKNFSYTPEGACQTLEIYRQRDRQADSSISQSNNRQATDKRADSTIL